MRTTRTTTRNLLVAACVLLVGTSATTLAFRVIQAQAVDGTYCRGNLVTCGAAVTFTRWFQPTVPFWVNSNAAADAGGGSPITQAQIQAGVAASFQSWKDVNNAYIKFSNQGTTAARIAADGINTTLFYNPGLDFSACVGTLGTVGSTLAITILTQDLPSGEIIDADVVFDSADSWDTTTACVNRDFVSTASHEYGHAIGIHHTNLAAGAMATRATMFAAYFCDAGIASGRSLEPDDQAAVQCLYPEQPTLALMDQTGSMGANTRMADAQNSANAFISDFADNTMAVSAFAEGSCADGTRDGYQDKQDWTMSVASLQAAVNATFPCGGTPMWESICCAVGKTAEMQPSNLLVYTDTEENSSNLVCSADCPSGFCGCLNLTDTLATATPTTVTVYVIDMTAYVGPAPENVPLDLGLLEGQGGQQPRCLQEPVNPDGSELIQLTQATGGLYCSAFDALSLRDARLAIQAHMGETAKDKTNPSNCDPGRFPIGDIQVYDPQGNPSSPFLDQTVEIFGQVTVRPDTFGGNPSNMWVEDCSGGIQVLLPSPGFPAKLGNFVRVVGQVLPAFGENVIGQLQDFEFLGEGEIPSLPIADPLDANAFGQIGQLMRVRGFAETEVPNDHFPLVRDLNALIPQRMQVLVHPDAGIDPSMIRKGQRYLIDGVVAAFSNPTEGDVFQIELRPRSAADFTAIFSTGGVPGEPVQLEVALSPLFPGLLEISYAPACDAVDHTIYYGPLGGVSSYNYSGAACGIGTTGSATFNPGGLSSAFFVVVGENGIDEGSYGRSSANVERPEDFGTIGCDRPQSLLGVVCE